MLRGALLKNARAVRLTTQRRSQSSSSGGGGGALKFIVGGTIVAAGGTLGYARYDSSVAKTLKDAIPQLEPVLEAIGADTSSGAAPTAPKVKPAEPASLMKKTKPLEVPKESPKPVEKAVKEPVKSASDANDGELFKQKQNFLLEQALRDATSAAEKNAADALSELDKVATKSEEYAKKLWRALDEASVTGEDQFMWKEANEAKSSQESAKKTAAQRTTEASKALTKLEEAIMKGRSNAATKDNLTLHQAEQTLSKLAEKLKASDELAAKKIQQVDRARKFETSVEESKKYLMEEVMAILPGKTAASMDKMSVEDLNVLIQHAHKKIQGLQKELSRVQLTDDEKAREYRKQLNALDKEISRQKNEVSKMVAEKLAEERKLFEIDLQNQLRQQLGIHTDHLREALEDQKQELNRKKQLEVEGAKEEERAKHVAHLSEAATSLQKMEGYLHARKQLDEASKKAKSLWLSCASLNNALSLGRTEKPDTLQPLGADIVPLKESFESSEFVKSVLSSIPEEAVTRGVYPEVALKERFSKVETACRRVALLEDNTGGGPIRYMLSHLMSFFMSYPKTVTQDELDKEIKVNPLMWDTLDVLSRVRASIHKEDMEQALRYANQLKGAPRQVAQDWINELRVHLETKQATTVLMAYAAGIVAQDLPK